MHLHLQQFREDLLAALRAEIAAAQALLDALAQEKAAIGAYDGGALELETARKQARVEALQMHTAKRGELLRRQGFAAGRGSIQDCLAALAPCPDLQRAFKELGGLAQACFEANRMNGRMINRSSRLIAGALDSLTGNGAAPRVYGNNGRTSSLGMQRGLGHA